MDRGHFWVVDREFLHVGNVDMRGLKAKTVDIKGLRVVDRTFVLDVRLWIWHVDLQKLWI